MKDCVDRGNFIREKMRLTHEFRFKRTKIESEDTSMLKSHNDGGKKDREIQVLEAEFRINVQKVDDKIKARDSALNNLADRVERPIQAYVTFNTIYGVEKAHSKFKSQSVLSYLRGGCETPQGFHGNVLRIKASPEPSTIAWENLRYGPWNTFCRRLLTTCAALLLIALSMVITFAAKYLQDLFTDQVGTKGVCPNNFVNMNTQTKRQYVLQDRELTHCYCDELSWQERKDDDLCSKYFQATLYVQMVTYFASLVVLLINAGLGAVLTRFSTFEKHHTEDSRAMSLMMRLFVLKYVNTSVVFLVNNNERFLAIFANYGYEGRSTDEFSTEWYNSIGVTIVLVQLGNVFMSHAIKAWQFYCHKYNITRAAKDPLFAITQDDLNKLHEGPPVRFAGMPTLRLKHV